MHLTLRYQDSAQRPACAALLRGTDAAAWLREIGRWNIPAGQLGCYLVPESIRSVRVAGLLVVVKDGSALPADLLEPYGAEAGGRLYVPVRAALWPATVPGELAAALLWPRQLLHPGIGLVGFDTADEIPLAALLDCAAPRATDWSRARPGPAPRPRLERVRILAPTVAEVVESFQEEIGTVPLAKLPGLTEDRPSAWQEALDNLRRRLLQAVAAVVRWLPGLPSGPVMGALGAILLVVMAGALLLSVFSQLGQGSFSGLIVPLIIVIARIWRSFSEKDTRRPATHRPAGRTRPGLFQRMERWLNTRIDNLEQKRQNEVERLLRLFDNNMEEALKYAIPLGGPYQDRGTAPQSARLGRRLTDFNLGGLGGGGRVDAWDLSAYQHQLSQQYRAAAAKEIEAGRPKKAAYIYAHLLADYPAAARALEQGGYHREAAALYKDHLHNLPAAAQCLENGGLLLEAADLYSELKEHEKAGDLHLRLEQPALAARHYERGVSLFLDNQDHPAAARLLADKLTDTGRAQQVLLDGWAASKQPEVCLRQYFDVLSTAPEADLSAHAQDIYRHHTPAGRRVPLLQVLTSVAEKHPAPELRAASLEIAYEVVSAEAGAGNVAHLALLRNFLPADRLIAADCSRYATRRPRPTGRRSQSGPVPPQLDATIEWKTAVTHRHQWVALGTRDDRLHLARGNWYGNVEYYSWLADMNGVYVLLLADEQHGNRILLRTSVALALETKTLPKNKYFSEALTVECPSWLPPWPTRVALLPDGVVAAVTKRERMIAVQRYAADGQLLPPWHHSIGTSDMALEEDERGWPCEVLYRDGRYYSYWGNYLFTWSEDGRNSIFCPLAAGHPVQVVPSAYSFKLQLAVITGTGLLLWQPKEPIKEDLSIVFPPHSSTPSDLRFVGAEHLVTISEAGGGLYTLGEEGGALVRSIETETPPIAILPTTNRQQFALLEATGRISLHQIEDE